jgi:hypothetical protein
MPYSTDVIPLLLKFKVKYGTLSTLGSDNTGQSQFCHYEIYSSAPFSAFLLPNEHLNILCLTLSLPNPVLYRPTYFYNFLFSHTTNSA